jgi:hypothetical protein
MDAEARITVGRHLMTADQLHKLETLFNDGYDHLWASVLKPLLEADAEQCYRETATDDPVAWRKACGKVEYINQRLHAFPQQVKQAVQALRSKEPK